MDMIVGVISDTHGMLAAAARNALKGVDRILHAGDIDGPEILKLLDAIAPVTAVRGNMDHGGWADDLHSADMISIDGTLIYMLHNLDALDLDPVAAGINVVISGHTHQAHIETIHGVLYLNPGSASHGRYGSPRSIAIIKLAKGRIRPEILALDG
ncbi:MAG: metallophosphoesterase family protein [Desulfobacteraceae bacterium]|jgi:putative phosphoesterase